MPRSDPAARRVENRIPSSDANPYLALAASLACGLSRHHQEDRSRRAGREPPPTKTRSTCRAACSKRSTCSRKTRSCASCSASIVRRDLRGDQAGGVRDLHGSDQPVGAGISCCSTSSAAITSRMTYQSPDLARLFLVRGNIGSRPRPTRRSTAIAVADVAIVGGGFTGLSAAAHLAKAGANVVLIEAHRFGDGASGRNGGQLGTGQRAWAEELEEEIGFSPRARRCSTWPKRPRPSRSISPSRTPIDIDYMPGQLSVAHKQRHVDDYKAHAEMHGDPLRLSAYPLHGCRRRRRRGSARRTISAASATPAPATSIR